MADVAAWLAVRAAANERTLDVRVVEAAALLHDVDKLATVAAADGSRVRLPHGDGSAAWLRDRGLGNLAPLVRDHPVTRLAEADVSARLAAAPLEARIVAYADKRAGQRLESMDERFASWRRRYPSGPEEQHGLGWGDDVATLVETRARALEADVCAAAGVVPAEVRRLRWSRHALRAARREAAA